MNTNLRKLYLIAMLFLPGLSNMTFSQAPDWNFASDTIFTLGSLATDASGNLYAANDFGDNFIAKYDNDGNQIWSISAAGDKTSPLGQDYQNSIALDPSGNILVAGYFTSDTMVLGSTEFIRVSALDMFVAKFNSDGGFVWCKTAAVGCIGNVGFHVASDASGNVFVVGSYSANTLTIGTTIFTNPCTYAAGCGAGNGCPSMLVVKYDPDGTVLWAKSSFAGMGTTYAYSVATDASGNAYVGGDFLGERSGIVKYNSNGDTLWTQKDGGWYVTVDASGNLYSGHGNKNSTPKDAIVKKYNTADGAVVWSTPSTGSANNSAYKISTDAEGNIYLTGTFTATSITFGTTTLANAGGSDLFISKYSSSGAVLWAVGLGGTANELLTTSVIDPAGNVFIGGIFFSPTLTIGATTLTNTGQLLGIVDIYFAKLGSNPNSIEGANIGNNFIEGPLVANPNPFNLSTSFSYMLSKAGTVNLEIVNVRGERVAGLLNEKQVAGRHSMTLNAARLPTGVYIARLTSGNTTRTKQFMLMK